MKLTWLSVALAVLAGCATSRSLDSFVSAAAGTSEPAPANVTEVEIKSFANLPECRRYVATGTRIAGERCFTKDVETAQNQAAERLLREDLESMRQQQMYRERARQAAEAARRRGAL